MHTRTYGTAHKATHLQHELCLREEGESKGMLVYSGCSMQRMQNRAECEQKQTNNTGQLPAPRTRDHAVEGGALVVQRLAGPADTLLA